ncbi:MAG TPA: hypothetical protein VK629_06420 [Steroidobacteraceae bacterium]|nr:hypothetical protein [Steroidobacteraceae bacterium]
MAMLYMCGPACSSPLINSGHTWSSLVSPLTLGMDSQNLHARLLESYSQAPDKHAAALKKSAAT